MAPEEWLEGTVVSIMNYGAFVRLEGDVDGMVHISQLDPHGERVDSVYNAVEVTLQFANIFFSAVFFFFFASLPPRWSNPAPARSWPRRSCILPSCFISCGGWPNAAVECWRREMFR